MTLMKRCCCWRELKTGAVAAGIFSMTVSIIQILLQLAVWIGCVSAGEEVTRVHYIVYIPLAALDLLLVVFSAILLQGLEKGISGRNMLLPWLGLTVIYLLYENSINVFFFYVAFTYTTNTEIRMSNKNMGLSKEWSPDILAELIVLVVYWGLKLIVYLMAVACVFSCYQQQAHSVEAENRQQTKQFSGYDGPIMHKPWWQNSVNPSSGPMMPIEREYFREPRRYDYDRFAQPTRYDERFPILSGQYEPKRFASGALYKEDRSAPEPGSCGEDRFRQPGPYRENHIMYGVQQYPPPRTLDEERAPHTICQPEYPPSRRQIVEPLRNSYNEPDWPRHMEYGFTSEVYPNLY